MSYTSFESIRYIAVRCCECGIDYNQEHADLDQVVYENTEEAIEALEASPTWHVCADTMTAYCPNHHPLKAQHVRANY